MRSGQLRIHVFIKLSKAPYADRGGSIVPRWRSQACPARGEHGRVDGLGGRVEVEDLPTNPHLRAREAEGVEGRCGPPSDSNLAYTCETASHWKTESGVGACRRVRDALVHHTLSWLRAHAESPASAQDPAHRPSNHSLFTKIRLTPRVNHTPPPHRPSSQLILALDHGLQGNTTSHAGAPSLPQRSRMRKVVIITITPGLPSPPHPTHGSYTISRPK
ncbi:unnamed protein product [Gadus morhua 'NCC']